MNVQMAYLIGMILGNGEIQRTNDRTTITIDIPYKKLRDDEGLDVAIYVAASIVDIRAVLEPLIGHELVVSRTNNSTKLSFTKNNEDYTMSEIMRLIGNGVHHRSMTMNPELFDISIDEKKELLRGIADVTGHIRKSNIERDEGTYRVYIEIPNNWQLVIDIANMLKSLDIPIQNINFGHPNCRDGNLKDYDEGHLDRWKREHQIKIYANEFLPIGFNIKHKQRALEKLAGELLLHLSPEKTHKYYWQRRKVRRMKPIHPGENDEFIPERIRGKHYDSWRGIAEDLGYHE